MSPANDPHDESLINDIVDEVVVQGALDWVNLAGLNSTVIQASNDHGVALPDEARILLGLEVARRVISCGLMEPGNITVEHRGFFARSIDVNSAVARIETGWRGPDVASMTLYGLNIWFANTPAGYEYAERVRSTVENVWSRRRS